MAVRLCEVATLGGRRSLGRPRPNPNRLYILSRSGAGARYPRGYAMTLSSVQGRSDDSSGRAARKCWREVAPTLRCQIARPSGYRQPDLSPREGMAHLSICSSSALESSGPSPEGRPNDRPVLAVVDFAHRAAGTKPCVVLRAPGARSKRRAPAPMSWWN
jgi:hypothetical protein